MLPLPGAKKTRRRSQVPTPILKKQLLQHQLVSPLKSKVAKVLVLVGAPRAALGGRVGQRQGARAVARPEVRPAGGVAGLAADVLRPEGLVGAVQHKQIFSSRKQDRLAVINSTHQQRI